MVNHFDAVVLGYLSKKLVIYVSNENILAKRSDQVLVMDKGCLEEQGSYSELFMKETSLLRKLIMNHNARIGGGKNIFGKLLEGSEFSQKIRSDKETIYTINQIAFLFNHRFNQSQYLKHYDGNTMKRGNYDFARLLASSCLLYKRQSDGRMSTFEYLNIENAGMIMMKDFVRTEGKGVFVLLSLAFSVLVLFYMSSDIWIGLWSKNMLSKRTEQYFVVYTSLSLVTLGFLVIRDLLYSKMMVNYVNGLCNQLTSKLILAKQSWIERTPPSRIIFRLTKDQSQIDEVLISNLRDACGNLLFLIGGLVVLNVIYFGFMLVLTVLGYVYLRRNMGRFLKVSQTFIQIMAEYRSKLVSIYLEILTTSVHLRVNDNEGFINEKFYEINDNFQRSFTHFNNFCQRWLRVRMMLFNVLFVLVMLFLPVLTKHYLSKAFLVSDWIISLGVIWSFKILNNLNSAVIQFSITLNEVSSVSRAMEYIEDIPEEFRIEGERDRNKRHDALLKNSAQGSKSKQLIGKDQFMNEYKRFMMSKRHINATSKIVDKIEVVTPKEFDLSSN